MSTRIPEYIGRGAEAILSRLIALVRWSIDSYAIFVVIGIAVGVAMAPAAIDTTAQPDGTVAVVHVDGAIDGMQSTQYSALMAEARSDADAVVIIANSGGGTAADSEEMYMQTKRTSDRMPVVTAVDAGAASGAYYTIAPSDHIVVKPASTLGSVGVVAPIPLDVEPNEIVATTGPYKQGSDNRAFFHDMETLQRAFVGAVYTHRGDELQLSEDELAHADTYLGGTAVELGLADEIGDRERAIQLAAEEAGLDRPEVRVLTPDDREARFLLRSTYLSSDAHNREMTDLDLYVEDGGDPPPYLMVPPGAVSSAETTAITSADAETVLEADDPEAVLEGTDSDTNETDDADTDLNETDDANGDPNETTEEMTTLTPLVGEVSP